MTRVLQNGACIGPPVRATAGLPEGDALSVVGMLSLSYVFYRYLSSPKLRPWPIRLCRQLVFHDHMPLLRHGNHIQFHT